MNGTGEEQKGVEITGGREKMGEKRAVRDGRLRGKNKGEKKERKLQD